MNNYKEQSLCTAIVQYMKMQHPKVIFKVDGGADANKASHVARGIYSKQQYKRGFPDFQIVKPNKYYYGLFLELKSGYNALFNKNGTMKRGGEDHHVEQYEFIKELRANGYFADFCYNFDTAKAVIDFYILDYTLTQKDYTFNSPTLSELKEEDANNFFSRFNL